jgi:hypothetical protein
MAIMGKAKRRFWQITGGNESVEAVKEAWIKLETCKERFSYLD